MYPTEAEVEMGRIILGEVLEDAGLLFCETHNLSFQELNKNVINRLNMGRSCESALGIAILRKFNSKG